MSSNELNFNHIMEKLRERAAADGKVTEEEERFLKSLGRDVNQYQIDLLDARDDGYISEDEFHDLVLQRDKILNDAMDFDSDSEDINTLVQELFDEINKHEIPGTFEDEKTDEQVEAEMRKD